MKKPNSSFEYKFVGDLFYVDTSKNSTNKGEKIKAEKIIIKAPNRKNLQNCLFLEQQYKKAEMKMGAYYMSAVSQEYIDKARNENKEKLKKQLDETTHKTIIDTLMSGDADLNKCFAILGYILSSGTENNPNALVDNKVQMNETIYNDIDSIEDLKCLLGSYIQNFFISSLIA